MTEHVHLRHFLAEYLEGELLLSKRQTVERHLKICAVCRQEMRVLRRTVGMLQRMPLETTPTDFMDKLRIRIEQYERKSQPVVNPPSAAPFTALVQQVLRLGRLSFLPPASRIPLSIGFVVLGLATILLRVPSEQTTATQRLPTGSTPPHSEVLSQGIGSITDEMVQAVATAESAPEQVFSPLIPSPSPTQSLNVGSALVWRVAGSEPTILRQQVKAMVSQRAEAVVVQEEEHLLVISLPAARLPTLLQELNTLGVANLPETAMVPNTLTVVVHIEFIRSPSVVAPPHPAQLSDNF